MSTWSELRKRALETLTPCPCCVSDNIRFWDWNETTAYWECNDCGEKWSVDLT